MMHVRNNIKKETYAVYRLLCLCLFRDTSQVQEVLIMRRESLRAVTVKMAVFCFVTSYTLKDNKIISIMIYL
jgi:hypothetical protein